MQFKKLQARHWLLPRASVVAITAERARSLSALDLDGSLHIPTFTLIPRALKLVACWAVHQILALIRPNVVDASLRSARTDVRIFEAFVNIYKFTLISITVFQPKFNQCMEKTRNILSMYFTKHNQNETEMTQNLNSILEYTRHRLLSQNDILRVSKSALLKD